jgi:hypothetical protein
MMGKSDIIFDVIGTLYLVKSLPCHGRGSSPVDSANLLPESSWRIGELHP